MNSINFSIIIPTYNSACTLHNTLQSISDQKLKPVQVIIIDALSKDATKEIVEEHKHLPIIFLSEKDKGIYDAMNKGIELAREDWLYFMGSDDVLFDNFVLANIAKAIDSETDIIYGDIIWQPSGQLESGQWNFDKFLNHNINHQRVFYKSSLFKQLGNYNLKYKVAADHELNIRFFCNEAVKSKYIPIKIAYYNELGFSANKIDEAFWKDWIQIVLKNFCPHLPKKLIYKNLYWYCWHQLKLKNYKNAISLFIKIILKTKDPTFVKHTLSQTLKSFKS